MCCAGSEPHRLCHSLRVTSLRVLCSDWIVFLMLKTWQPGHFLRRVYCAGALAGFSFVRYISDLSNRMRKDEAFQYQVVATVYCSGLLTVSYSCDYAG